MSIIPQPSLAGKTLPVSIDFAAASLAQHLGKRLVRFNELGTGAGREGISGRVAGVPITDIDYWEGRWVLCPLRLEQETGEGLTLTDAVVAASREHRIVSTPVVGRDGSIKEYINAGDWAINIVVGLQRLNDSGEIVDEWPDEELRRLRKLLESKKALQVHSAFLAALQIDRIVIRSYSLSQMTESNYQTVNISAVSDEDYKIFSDQY